MGIALEAPVAEVQALRFAHDAPRVVHREVAEQVDLLQLPLVGVQAGDAHRIHARLQANQREAVDAAVEEPFARGRAVGPVEPHAQARALLHRQLHATLGHVHDLEVEAHFKGRGGVVLRPGVALGDAVGVDLPHAQLLTKDALRLPDLQAIGDDLAVQRAAADVQRQGVGRSALELRHRAQRRKHALRAVGMLVGEAQRVAMGRFVMLHEVHAAPSGLQRVDEGRAAIVRSAGQFPSLVRPRVVGVDAALHRKRDAHLAAVRAVAVHGDQQAVVTAAAQHGQNLIVLAAGAALDAHFIGQQVVQRMQQPTLALRVAHLRAIVQRRDAPVRRALDQLRRVAQPDHPSARVQIAVQQLHGACKERSHLRHHHSAVAALPHREQLAVDGSALGEDGLVAEIEVPMGAQQRLGQAVTPVALDVPGHDVGIRPAHVHLHMI